MKKHIHLEIAVALFFIAVCISTILAVFTFLTTYKRTLTNYHSAAMDLLDTISDTAAVACYLGQRDMMQDVVKGITKNRYVAGCTIMDSNGNEVRSGQRVLNHIQNARYVIRYPLKTPFETENSQNNTNIGILILLQNQNLLENTAKKAATRDILSLICITFFTAFLTSGLVYVLSTKPITTIAMVLHNTKPGNPDPLEIPSWHKKNEIGTLISDINSLIKRNAQALNAERSLRKRLAFLEERYRTIFEKANSGIFLADKNGKVLIYNPFFLGLAEYTSNPKNVLDNFINLFLDKEKVSFLVNNTITKKQASSSDLIIDGKAAHRKWVHAVFINCEDDQNGSMIECMLYDITQRHLKEEKNRQIASRDHLTGLLNRRGGEIQMDSILSSCQPDHKIAFFLLDLDGFKQVNDTFGHDAGDKILVEMAHRLQSINRATDTIIRWGGDEFVLILHGDINKETCFGIANKIIDSLNVPVDLGNNQSGTVGVSIGISRMSGKTADKDSLMRSADKAMYMVKKQKKNGICYCDEDEKTCETIFR